MSGQTGTHVQDGVSGVRDTDRDSVLAATVRETTLRRSCVIYRSTVTVSCRVSTNTRFLRNKLIHLLINLLTDLFADWLSSLLVDQSVEWFKVQINFYPSK